jgi:HNH endonuclease
MQTIYNESDLFGESGSEEDGASPPEIWKTHPSHPGYEFSNQGRVFSLRSGRFLKGRTERTGHIYLELVPRNPQGRRSQLPLHRLILEAFVGLCPPNKELVCHINGDPRDNRIANLRWGTSQENSLDRHKHNGTSKGGKRSRAVKRSVLNSEIQSALRDRLSDAILARKNEETVIIPMTLTKEIIEILTVKA